MVINTIILTFAASQKKQENLYKIYITMTKNNSMNLEGMSYETPSVNVLNVQSEGVLCASGGFSIKDWETDDDSLDF